MTQTIGFFTAGEIPTAGELTDIAELQALTDASYTVHIRSGLAGVSPSYGHGIETFDFVAGTPPAAYSGADTINPDAATGTFITGSNAKVQNSAAGVSVNGGISFSGGNPVVTLPATEALVANGGSVTVKNSAASVTKTGTATVAAGLISGVALASTEAIISNGGNVNVKNSAASVTKVATATVAAGLLSGVALAATIALVTNGDTVTATGSGTTATIAVALGVVTGVALT